jgi:pentalenene oxygenase
MMMTTENANELPSLDTSSLEPIPGENLNEPKIYGYSIESWLAAVESMGPAFTATLGGQDCVVIATDEANKQAWRTPDDWAYRETDAGTFFRNQMGEDHVSALDAEPHRRLRKLILPAFGAASMQRELPLVSNILEEGFANAAGKATDLFSTFCRVFATALSHTQIKTEISDGLIEKLCQFEEEFICGQQLSLEDQDIWFARDSYQALKSDAFGYFNGAVAEHKAGSNSSDSLGLLINRTPPEAFENLTDSELAEAAYLLSVAGVGNIANMLCPALYAIQGTEWIDRLRQEFADFAPEKLTGMKDFPVTKAILSESERFFAPAPVIPKRTTQDLNFLGKFIPSGTLIMHLHTLSHFEKGRYPDPLIFNPQRWLDQDLEKANAFGGGKHMCLGMGVTRVYLPLALALLVPNYNIKIPEAPSATFIDPEFKPSPKTTKMTGTLMPR